MKKKIVILGSTGSIGKTTLKILKKDKKKFDIKILSTNKNIYLVVKQAKYFNVKNIIISDYKKYLEAKIKFKKLSINFYNKFSVIDKILKKNKIFYSMISLVGIEGLEPSLRMIKFSDNIAIANKESIICGWNLIRNNLKKYNTNFIPIDSEHFSIFSLIKNISSKDIDKIFITASGGPFLNLPKSKLNKVSLKEALQHPIWKMGNKITIDSATMMNKVFEVIEAKNIFDLNYKQISILVHPKSYVHSIVKFNSGIIKVLLHEPNMKIPIHNSIYSSEKKIKTKQLNLNILNNLNLKAIDKKKFPLTYILSKLPKKNSLYETALITINDYFVKRFLDKKIDFYNLLKLIHKYTNSKEINNLKKIKVKNISQIFKIRKYVSYKLDKIGI
jgi:1-deoxy-D-xylulose-5-phosphate reductoisomerase